MADGHSLFKSFKSGSIPRSTLSSLATYPVMRLLNTDELTFREFPGDEKPPYAILSHRWGEEEVSYSDLRKGRAKDGEGLRKIMDFRKLARSDHFNWCWVDTCCIDKKSSAELSEAINSMGNWYGQAKKCYVYLADASLAESRSWEKSCWFKRAWTLQELLFPKWLIFYDRSWWKLGSRGDLADTISMVTGIDAIILCKWSFEEPACAAEIMHWASTRSCTKPEDMAYSLLGLFKVNLPLLYGEGSQRAMRRLQMEIIRYSDDETILAWSLPEQESLTKQRFQALLADDIPKSELVKYSKSEIFGNECSRTLLADDVSYFGLAKFVRPSITRFDRGSWVITNKGLQLKLPAGTWIEPRLDGILIMRIDVQTGKDRSALCLLLKKDSNSNTWVRAGNQLLRPSEMPQYFGAVPRYGKEPRTIYVRLGMEAGAVSYNRVW